MQAVGPSGVLFVLGRICAAVCEALCPWRQVVSRQVCVALEHRVAGPAAKFLQDVQWCAALHVPTGPGVSQIVPAKLPDARAIQGLVPSRRAHLLDRFAVESEHDVERPGARNRRESGVRQPAAGQARTHGLAWSCRRVADVWRRRVLFGLSYLIPNAAVCEYPQDRSWIMGIDTEVRNMYSSTRKNR
jgi:hypothetical protein